MSSASGKPIIRGGGAKPILLSYLWGLGCAFLGGTVVNRIMQPEKATFTYSPLYSIFPILNILPLQMPRYAHLFEKSAPSPSAEETASSTSPSQ